MTGDEMKWQQMKKLQVNCLAVSWCQTMNPGPGAAWEILEMTMLT